jgi:hypothetical protein
MTVIAGDLRVKMGLEFIFNGTTAPVIWKDLCPLKLPKGSTKGCEEVHGNSVFA